MKYAVIQKQNNISHEWYDYELLSFECSADRLNHLDNGSGSRKRVVPIDARVYQKLSKDLVTTHIRIV